MRKTKLFVIPYAGGTTSIYRNWGKELHPSIEIVPLELAGKGMRFGEDFYPDFESALNDLYHNLLSKSDNDPYALFGHSMGGLLAFELAHKLQRTNFRKPEHVFLSGMSLPNIKSAKKYSNLDDKQLLNELILLGGTPIEIIESEELISLFLPIVRSDFTLIENRNIPSYYPHLQMDASILSGTDDSTISAIEPESWEALFEKKCSFYNINGDHFFINSQKGLVINIINTTLKPLNFDVHS